jgi:hypothetical protein
MTTDKLYVVTRLDLTPAQQAVQACHALANFCAGHTEEFFRWHLGSNTLVLLSVPNEEALIRLTSEAAYEGFRYTRFQEPDLGDSTTAATFEPKAGPILKKLQPTLGTAAMAFEKTVGPLVGKLGSALTRDTDRNSLQLVENVTESL